MKIEPIIWLADSELQCEIYSVLRKSEAKKLS